MDTTDKRPLSGEHEDLYRARGLGPWLGRNRWLLARLFTVIVFSFAASTVATNFSYGLEIRPIPLSAEQLNAGRLPAGTELGDYVRISGTPEIGKIENGRVGNAKSEIGVVSRYETAYLYFRLQETGDNLLIQSTQGLPRDIQSSEERVWSGKLQNVGTVIFHSTTQEGLENANLPHGEKIPVINTGETPKYLREIFPAYSAIIGLWLLSIAWLAWKRNKPLVGL